MALKGRAKQPKPLEGEKHLQRVRRICSALPETMEKLSHGEPTWFVRKKVFAMFANNHHNDGHIAIWIPAAIGIQEMLIERSPKKFYRPPYVGVRGWVGIELNRVTDKELALHINQAWRLIAPQKLQDEFEAQTKLTARDFHVQFEGAGSLARHHSELLSNGLYLFEDDLAATGVFTTSVITCGAWLLELYDLRSGELFFISGKEHIRPKTSRFGVLYPPFSITQPSFKNVQSHLIGVAATDSLPEEFIGAPIVFDTNRLERPSNLQQIVEILKAGINRQPIELNPRPSWLSLKAKKLIDESHSVDPSIARVASRVGVTHAHLSRQFKRDFEMSPSAYLRQLRVADVPLRLAKGEEIVNVSLDVGYNDLSRFYKQFRKTTKTSPGVCKTIMRPRR